MANVEIQTLIDQGVVSAPISVTDGTTTVDPATSLRLPAGTLSDLGSGEGAVGLIITRLGPFRVNYNTPNIGDGIKVADLDAGTVVIGAWVEVLVPWDAHADDARVDVCAGGATWGSPNFNYFTVTASRVGANIGPTAPDADVAPAALVREFPTGGQVTSSQNSPVRLVTAGALVACTANDGSATQGSADIYAIIATPAA
jgi:hypothetical protein